MKNFGDLTKRLKKDLLLANGNKTWCQRVSEIDGSLFQTMKLFAFSIEICSSFNFCS